jgi:hypothetical protein
MIIVNANEIFHETLMILVLQTKASFFKIFNDREGFLLGVDHIWVAVQQGRYPLAG